MVTDIHVPNVCGTKYCVFDFEATGIDHESEYITQIGAVIVDNMQIMQRNTFDCLVRPPKKIPSKIEAYTSITNNMVMSAPDFSEVFWSFREFVGDAVMVAQCGFEFDYALLDNECMRNNCPRMVNQRLDTKVMYAAIHGDEDATFSTDYLIQKYAVKKEDLRRHSAIGDSIAVARILCEILKEMDALGFHDLDVVDLLHIKKYIPNDL